MLASDEEGVRAALSGALRGENADIRLLTLRILSKLGHKPEPTLAAMIGSCEDGDRIMRLATLEPVAYFGANPKATKPILRQ